MTPEDLKAQLRGIIAFTVTPFTDAEELDAAALAANVDRLVLNGVDSIVVCGGVGEYYSLSIDETVECFRTAIDAAGNRVPVLAGVGHSTKIACELAAEAAAAGASGLMINPCYFVEPSVSGLIQHYRAIARTSGLGIMAFSRKNAVYTPAILAALAEVQEVVAVKDEYGDLRLFIESIDCFGDRFAWINGMAEALIGPYSVAGAQAFTSGIVNFAPHLTFQARALSESEQWDALRRLLGEFILPLSELRSRRAGNEVSVVKEAMNHIGYAGGKVRLPLEPLDDDDRAALEQLLERLGTSVSL